MLPFRHRYNDVNLLTVEGIAYCLHTIEDPHGELDAPEKRVCGFVIGKFVGTGIPAPACFATGCLIVPRGTKRGWTLVATARGYVVASSCRRFLLADRPDLISHSKQSGPIPFSCTLGQVALWAQSLATRRQKASRHCLDDDTAS